MPDPCAAGEDAPAEPAIPKASRHVGRGPVTVRSVGASNLVRVKASGLGLGPGRCLRLTTASVGEPGKHRHHLLPFRRPGARRPSDS